MPENHQPAPSTKRLHCNIFLFCPRLCFFLRLLASSSSERSYVVPSLHRTRTHVQYHLGFEKPASVHLFSAISQAIAASTPSRPFQTNSGHNRPWTKTVASVEKSLSWIAHLCRAIFRPLVPSFIHTKILWNCWIVCSEPAAKTFAINSIIFG